MPAKPSYSHRLKTAIENIERSSKSLFGRADVEELLGVSKPSAWRILKACKAQKAPGGALQFERKELLKALRKLAKGDVIAAEVERHDRLAAQLESMRTMIQSRRIEVAKDTEAASLLRSHLSSLPANVVLTPRELRIKFESFEEFMQSMAAWVYALQNDLDEIRKVIEATQ